MADAAQGQAEAAVATPAPFVTLGEGDAPEREPEAATTETPSGEQTPASAADDSTPLDDVEYDANDPAQKAAYDALRKQMLPKWQARIEKLKGKPGETPPEPAAEPVAQQQAAQTDTWDPYTVPLASFTYTGDPEPEGSELAGFESSIDRRIDAGVKKAIEFTLNEMRQNDARLREQAVVQTAQQAIGAYAEVLQNHPDWDEHAAEVAEFAAVSGELAKRNPEKWIRAVEGITGIRRQPADSAQADAAQIQQGQQNQRLARKPLSVVERPSQARVQSAPSVGNLTLQQALDKHMAARRR